MPPRIWRSALFTSSTCLTFSASVLHALQGCFQDNCYAFAFYILAFPMKNAPHKSFVHSMRNNWKLCLITIYNINKHLYYISPSSIIHLATCTPLADACDNECVTPLQSPITYSPFFSVSRWLSITVSIL